MLLQHSLGLTFLGLLSLAQGNEGYDGVDMAYPDEIPTRQLLAARVVIEEVKRNEDIPIQKDVMLHYLEDTDNESRLAAQMLLTADLPTLLLEDMDSEISKVECNQSSIQLELLPSVYTALKTALKSHPKFYTITAHEACNSHGGRLPYLVSDVIFSDKDSTAVFKSSPVNWKDVYSIDLNWGPHDQETKTYIRHLSPRQAAASTVASTAVPSDVGAPTTDVDFPLQTSFINLPLLNASSDDAGIGLTCLNCSTFGRFDLISGTASSQPNMTTTGSISANLDGFEVYVLLELELFSDSDASQEEIPWFTWHLLGLSIPDVGSIGPIYQPSFMFTSTSPTNVTLTSGFEIRVPDSSIAITLDPANVSISGFSGTTFNILPFDSEELNPVAQFNISLHHELLFGIDLFDGGFEVDAGVFLDAPKLGLKIESLDHVDINCNPTDDSSVSNPISSMFGNLTNVEPFIDFDGGFQVDGTVLWIFGSGDDFTVFDKDITMPTLCLAHEIVSTTAVATVTGTASAAATSDWQTASLALSSALATVSPTGSSHKNAAARSKKCSHLFGVGGSLVVSILLALV